MEELVELNKETTNKIYREFMQNEIKKKIEMLLKIKSTLSQTNSVCLLAFLMELHETNPMIESTHYQEFTDTVEMVKSELYRYIHKSMHIYLDKITFVSEESKNDSFDEEEFVRKIVEEVFVIFTTKELENHVYNFLNPKIKKVPSYTNRYLKNIKEYFSETKTKIAIFGSFKETEKNEFLNFVAENIEIGDEFFTGIYFFNQKFYKFIKNYVEDENLKVFYEFIPEIDFEKIQFIEKEYLNNGNKISLEDNVNEIKLSYKAYGKKAENSEILKSLLKKFASKREIIIKKFLLDENLIKRNDIMEIIIENYEFLSENLFLFSLTIEESLKIAEKNANLLNKILSNLENYTNEEIIKVATAVANEENEEFLISICNNILESNSKTNITFINSFIMAKTLSNGMKNYFLSKIGNNPKYFYAMMPYFKKEVNLQSLSQFLFDEESLKYFLRIFTLGEIFYFAHYVEQIDCAVRITGLCINSPDFDESVVLFAVPKMENDTLPPLFMRTAILSFLKLPEMKKFYINLLFRVLKRNIWKEKQLFRGFSKLIEIIGVDAIKVIIELPPNELVMLLKENRPILKLSRLFLEHSGEIEEIKVRRFKSIVFSVK